MDGIFPEEFAPRILINLPEMFINENWATIDEALSFDLENSTDSIGAVSGDGARQIPALMAVSKMPIELKCKHLDKLIVLIDFYSFVNIMRVKLASVYCAPVDERMKRLLRMNALTLELKYLISKMTIEEINGLLNYLNSNIFSLNARIGLEIIHRIYDARIVPPETLFLILALCHY